MVFIVESLQHKLDRIRKPRVHITYDVEIGSAIEKKELAFVVGIMSDLSGHREKELPAIKKRKFVEIDRDNFNHVMEAIRPHLHIVVPNHLGTKGDKLAFEMYFNNLDDFGPLEIVKNNEELRKIYDTRNSLKDFLTKIDGNEPLEELLIQIVTDTKVRADLRKQVEAAQAKIQSEKDKNKSASGADTQSSETPEKGGK